MVQPEVLLGVRSGPWPKDFHKDGPCAGASLELLWASAFPRGEPFL